MKKKIKFPIFGWFVVKKLELVGILESYQYSVIKIVGKINKIF